MNTALPVYRGELQCRMLGMAVEAFTPTGEICLPDEAGELVCLKPFPCQPIGFWPLPGYGSKDEVEAAKIRYQLAYFSEFANVWCELWFLFLRSCVLRSLEPCMTNFDLLCTPLLYRPR